MKILLILSTLKTWMTTTVIKLSTTSCESLEWQQLSHRKKQKARGVNIVLPKYSPACFYTLCVGSLFTCYHAQKVIFVLEFMCVCTKLRLQISIQFEHGNVDTNYPWMHVVIFVCVCVCVLFFSLTTQSQAVSDGGKHEQPTFPVTHTCLCVKACFWRKSLDLVSLSVNVCLLINGCACTLACAAELNMSARGCGGSSSSLPGTPGGESGPVNRVLSWAVSFEKLLEDPCGVQHFTVSCTRPRVVLRFSTGSGAEEEQFDMVFLSSCATCVHARRVSLSADLPEVWSERREHFILAGLWKVQEDPCWLFEWGTVNLGMCHFCVFWSSELLLNLNGLCPFYWNPSWHFPNFS